MPKGRQRASGRARAVPGAQQGQAEAGGQDWAVAAPSAGGTGAGAIWKSLGEGLEVLGSVGSSSPALCSPITRAHVPKYRGGTDQPLSPNALVFMHLRFT